MMEIYAEILNSAIYPAGWSFVLLQVCIALGLSLFATAIFCAFRRFQISIFLMLGCIAFIIFKICIILLIFNFISSVPQNPDLLLSTLQRNIFLILFFIVTPVIILASIVFKPRNERYKGMSYIMAGLLFCCCISIFIADTSIIGLDVGGNLVGKVEAGIPEDDVRNPSTVGFLSTRFISISDSILLYVCLSIIILWYLFSKFNTTSQKTIDSEKAKKQISINYGVIITSLILIFLTVYLFSQIESFYKSAADSSTTGHGTSAIGSINSGIYFSCLLITIIMFSHIISSHINIYLLSIVCFIITLIAIYSILSDGIYSLTNRLLELAEFSETYRAEIDKTNHFKPFLQLPTNPIYGAVILIYFGYLFTHYINNQEKKIEYGKNTVISFFGGLSLTLFIFNNNLRFGGIVGGKVVKEVRRQFREIPGIMEGTTKPDYLSLSKNISIFVFENDIIFFVIPIILILLYYYLVKPKFTNNKQLSPKMMVLTFAVLTSLILVFFTYGNRYSSYMSKTYIENGHLGGKGSDAHKASVSSDTLSNGIYSASLSSLAMILFYSSIIFLANGPVELKPNSFKVKSKNQEEEQNANNSPPEDRIDITSPKLPTKSDMNHQIGLEKQKMWLNFLKFLLGTFVLGLITTLISSNHKARQITMAEIEKETKQLEMFMNLPERKLEERKAFAIYFATLSRNPELKAAWTDYLQSIEDEIAVTKEMKKIQRENIRKKAEQYSTILLELLRKNPELLKSRPELTLELIQKIEQFSKLGDDSAN